MTNYLYFAVDGGKALELAKKHVAEHAATIERNVETVKPLNVDRYVVSVLDGTVCGVEFNGALHKDFKKPDRRGVSYPKKGTEWAEKFAAVKGYDKRGFELAKELGFPTTLYYKSDDCNGMTGTTSGINSGVGLLWISEDGPFALYVADISERVAYYESQGYTVDDACKHFKPKFDGARPILKEEWDLVVAQHELEEAKRKAEKTKEAV